MPSETNFSQVYSHKILDLAASIPRLGRLAAPQATAKAHSKLCGSTIIVDLVMAEGRVIDFAQDVKACALGQAAASIMGRHVIGSSADELRALRDEVWAMLKESGPPPKGKWAEIAILEPVRDYKARHASTLLTFDATVDCVSQIEQAAAAGK
jgi:NifU-like protein involved in Fe-S cluster formation